MPVYEINRGGLSSDARALNKETGILVEAKNRQEAIKILGGHPFGCRPNHPNFFFKRSELEKNPAWKQVDYASIDLSKIVFRAATVFALEVMSGIDLNVIFWEDQESHYDGGPMIYVEDWYDAPELLQISTNYYFFLKNVGTLYRKKS